LHNNLLKSQFGYLTLESVAYSRTSTTKQGS
jgi:hypothetical protein